MEVNRMTAENPASSPETGRWQYGERVTERVTTRAAGAFYGSLEVVDR